MADKLPDPEDVKPKASAIGYLKAWGESSFTPALAATLIAGQHLRPPQMLPLSFAPVLMFSSYLNINDYKIDGAGLSSAWSGLYLLLANRRKHKLLQKYGVRGWVRGATMGVCAANLVAGGFVYMLGKRKDEASGNDA